MTGLRMATDHRDVRVTIFDPELDPDGSLAGRLADLLVDNFGPP